MKTNWSVVLIIVVWMVYVIRLEMRVDRLEHPKSPSEKDR